MRYVIIAILISVFFVFGTPDYLSGVSADFWLKALTYHFFHANIFHLAANCLSLWVIFKRRSNIIQVIVAYIIATLAFAAATTPVIGFSNIIFAITGLRTPPLSHPWWKSRSAIMFFSVMLATFAIPQVSAVTHILSFITGAAISIVTKFSRRLTSDYRRAAY